MKIDNHSPSININKSIDLIKKCLTSNWISSSGKYVKEFEKEICKFTGAKYAVACNTGTAALHISLKIAGVTQNDEVIVPSLTFVATINSIRYNQAFPVFMDSDDNYNLDIKKTVEFLEKKQPLKVIVLTKKVAVK